MNSTDISQVSMHFGKGTPELKSAHLVIIQSYDRPPLVYLCCNSKELPQPSSLWPCDAFSVLSNWPTFMDICGLLQYHDHILLYFWQKSAFAPSIVWQTIGSFTNCCKKCHKIELVTWVTLYCYHDLPP